MSTKLKRIVEALTVAALSVAVLAALAGTAEARGMASTQTARDTGRVVVVLEHASSTLASAVSAPGETFAQIPPAAGTWLLTIALVGLMVWMLPMRRTTRFEAESWGISMGYGTPNFEETSLVLSGKPPKRRRVGPVRAPNGRPSPSGGLALGAHDARVRRAALRGRTRWRARKARAARSRAARRTRLLLRPEHHSRPQRTRIRETITMNTHEENGGREHTPLGLVWIRSRSWLAALGLEKELSVVTRVHKGLAAPSGEAPSAVMLCLDQGDDVAAEVGEARAVAPDAVVLVYAPFADLALACDALRAGASGLLHTGLSPQEVRRAISLAHKGETVLPRKLLGTWLEEGRCTDPNLVLQPRQLEILRLASEGLTDAQIARRLYLAESTVEQHLRAAYKQLGVRNRSEAVGLLRRHGALPLSGR